MAAAGGGGAYEAEGSLELGLQEMDLAVAFGVDGRWMVSRHRALFDGCVGGAGDAGGAGSDALCALCMLEAVEFSKYAGGAGGDAPCATLYSLEAVESRLVCRR